MNRFNIVVDTTMLTNVAGTDSKEVKDLLSLALVLQIMLLGYCRCACCGAPRSSAQNGCAKSVTACC
jgi:glucan phosphoethanolaminetransferase (alkaline phosphatase superfamily)